MIARSERRQYLATLTLNLLAISFGAACGWTSPAFLELTSETNPLLQTGPITSVEASWIGCIDSLGAVAGTLFFGSISDRLGGKRSLLITSLPMIVCWVLLTIAQDVITMCIARFIGGFSGGGIFMLTPIFIAEIADDRIRGGLASSIALSSNLGLLGIFFLGNCVSYRVYSSVFIALPITFFFVMFFFIPETPQRLIATNKHTEAEKSLQFYRNDKNYRLPISMTKKESPDSDYPNDELLKDEKKSLEGQGPTLWQDLKTKAVRRAVLIGTVMMWFNQFCGLFTMMTYAATIFKVSGSSLSPNNSSVLVAISQLLGSYCSTLCVDRFGRKILLAASGFGIALGSTGLGLYIFCKVELLMDMESVSWISLLCFCFSIFIGNCGIVALPFVIVSEIFPLRISRIASSYCMCVMFGLCFVAVKYFPIVSDMVGPHYCFFFFSGCAFVGALFSTFGMPETKRKSFEEIEMLLSR